MTYEQLEANWPFGPQFYPRELAQLLAVRPIVAEQLCKKLRVSRIKCAIGRMYHTADFLIRLRRRQDLLQWAEVQNEVFNIGETQLTLELSSSFPPYYTAEPKE